MAVDFNKYSNVTDMDTYPFSGIVFGANAPLLEVELNEMQQIFKKQLYRLSKSIAPCIIPLGDKPYELSDYNVAGRKIELTLKNLIFIDNEGRTFYIGSGSRALECPIYSDVCKVYVCADTTTFNHNSVITEHGFLKSDITAGSSQISNPISDERIGVETTRREATTYKFYCDSNGNDSIPASAIVIGSFYRNNGSTVEFVPNEEVWGSIPNRISSIKKLYGDTVINVGRKKDTEVGEYSVAVGYDTTASGSSSHAEGYESTASGQYSHAEGSSTASGDYSHAEGDSTTASGEDSHAEGWSTTAENVASHAEGRTTTASGYVSHAEGAYTTASGMYSHAEGCYTKANGDCSHAEGDSTSAQGEASHAEGRSTTASGNCSHAEGKSTNSFIELISQNVDEFGDPIISAGSPNSEITSLWYKSGRFSLAKGEGSHVEGTDCLALNTNSHAEGCNTTASGEHSHAEGMGNTAYGNHSHAEGGATKANGECSHAEGYFTSTSISGKYAHAEGNSTTASGSSSHAEGCGTEASGGSSHAEGVDTVALNNQHAQGHYNQTGNAPENSSSGTSTGTAFVIGNGTSSYRSNAFRVTGEGKVYATNTSISTGADYAEYFEWSDENPNNEDRVGYFVTFDEDNEEKIRIANKEDYILGIISGQPCVLGNGDEDWKKRYILDDFGRYIQETFEYEEKEIDEETGEEITVTKTGTKWKENPEYDQTKPYIPRDQRQEWSAVGMLGVLSVYDDGTCKVNGYCRCADGGIATASENGYRVIKRVTENIVRIVLK